MRQRGVISGVGISLLGEALQIGRGVQVEAKSRGVCGGINFDELDIGGDGDDIVVDIAIGDKEGVRRIEMGLQGVLERKEGEGDWERETTGDRT